MQPRERDVRYLLAGSFYRMAYTDWGAEDAPAVICVHGLTRTGRDFDILASALADKFRVICPDLPGRGGSDWLSEPALYQPLSYIQALSHLLAQLGRGVMWVGTSLGGICGMALGAAPGQPITRMVLNDVGPYIPASAIARIRDYLSAKIDFRDLAELEQYLRRIHASFGPLSDAQWAALARSSSCVLPGGRIGLHYDPAITQPIVAAGAAEVNMDPWWQRLAMPILALRGESSDLLLPDTLEKMRQSGAETHIVPGAGHAPALMDEPTIDVIRNFLLRGV